MSTETPARKDADTDPSETAGAALHDAADTVIRNTADTAIRDAADTGPRKQGDDGPRVPTDPDELPPFTEQLSQQLGGVKGVVEAAVPITLFVVLNPLLPDQMGPLTGLQWAIVISASSALAIAGWRAARRESVRHALNGLFGIALGAFLAWRSDDARDFYLPGIIQGAVYGVLLIVSALMRHPIIGWIYAVVAQGGKKEWRDNTRLVDVLSRITILWGVVFIVKNALRSWLYVIDAENALGLVTLFGGWPVTIALTAFTIWAVRRHMKVDEAAVPKAA